METTASDIRSYRVGGSFSLVSGLAVDARRFDSSVMCFSLCSTSGDLDFGRAAPQIGFC